MLIENATLHIMGFGVSRDATSAIHRTLKLMPGQNDVPDADWAEVKKNCPSVQTLIDAGELKEQDSTPLAKRPIKEAVRVVKDTNDEALLAKWMAEDARKDVQAAIAAQMKAITPSADEEKAAKR